MTRQGRQFAAAALAALAVTAGAAYAATGPSSSESPYLVRSERGVVTKSVLTVGDSVDGYRMVGIPDGLGAFSNGDGTFTLLMNHELGSSVGVERAHGAPGAFVSKWTIDEETLEVEHGQDLIEDIATWDAGSGDYNRASEGIALGRLCSADLARRSAFFDSASGTGYDGRIFTNGEENGTGGRAFGHTLNGTSYELPALGKMNFENVVANPATGEKTVAVATDDVAGGQVYVYAGDKKSTGNPVEKAGLNDGTLYGIKVAGYAAEDAASGIPSGTRFTGYALGDVRNDTGESLQSDSVDGGVTGFQRPEDGAWDPTDPSVFYFVTTASFDGRSRLWRLRFDDPADPSAGGTIGMVLDGTEGQHMFDNLTVNGRGQVIIQEDPGNQAYIARIWRYDPTTDELTEVAHHDEDRFAPGAEDFLTRDEESSGVISVGSILGRGWYLADVQAHYAQPGELVEGGQLVALQIPPGQK